MAAGEPPMIRPLTVLLVAITNENSEDKNIKLKLSISYWWVLYRRLEMR